MLIKKKSTIVIMLSIIIVGVALILTLASFFVYVIYEEKQNIVKHDSDMAKINVRLYSKYIHIEQFKAEIRPMPTGDELVVKGVVKNKGDKIVSSLGIIINFKDKSNVPVYTALFVEKKIIKPDSETPFVYRVNAEPIYSLRLFKKGSANSLKLWSGKIDHQISEIRFYESGM